MKRFAYLITAILCISTALAADIAPKPAVECHPRSGLPNFYQKLREGKEVSIAYLGGSITAQPGWRVKSRAWFQKQFPNAKVNEIYAAIGGTGSELGVFRVDYDVLQHKPDLLFVEFAVNDGGTSPDIIIRSMEGIVRKTWALNPATDICFVYTLVEGMVPEIQGGFMPRAAGIMEDIADHYKIPTIHMGIEIAKMAKEGTLIMKSDKKPSNEGPMIFSSDGVHPHVETGHELYMQAIERSMKQIEPLKDAKAHDLPAPMRDDNFEKATKLSMETVTPGDGWEKLPSDSGLGKRFLSNMPTLWAARKPGTTLEFKFKGTFVGFYDLLGPDCGQVTVNVDGKESVVKRFDGYCEYHRIAMLVVDRSLPDGLHNVKVTVHPEQPDKLNILHKQRHDDFMKNPAKYDGTTWYVGGVFIAGELVK